MLIDSLQVLVKSFLKLAKSSLKLVIAYLKYCKAISINRFLKAKKYFKKWVSFWRKVGLLEIFL